MGRGNIHVLGCPAFEEGLLGRDHAPAGVDHIVIQDAGPSTHFSNDFDNLRPAVFAACFVHDGEVGAEDIRKFFRLLRAAGIGGDHDGIVKLLPSKVFRKDGPCIEDVNGDREESLDLIGVQRKGNEVVGTGLFEEMCREFGGDGLSRFCDAILTGIRKTGDNHVYAMGETQFRGLTHKEEFHQRFIRKYPRRLQEVHILAAN